jgi:hypothetical protein
MLPLFAVKSYTRGCKATSGTVFVLGGETAGMIFSGYRGLLVTTAESMYALLKEAFLIRLTYSQSND